MYDVFGTGRTALKTSFSKYHRQYDADPFLVYADAGLRSELRNWFDVDLVPNTVGTRSGIAKPTDNDRIAQDNEIGTGSPTFGARADRKAVDLNRQYNLEFTAGVQHQVAPRLAVGFMFYKRSIKNIQLTDRVLIDGTDYTAFNTTIPASEWATIARDPAAAAVLDQNEVITLYNLNNASNADYNSAMVDRSSSDNQSLYTGMEASFSMRFLAGSTIFGSWTAERNVSVFCESDDNPNGPTTNDLYQGRPVSQGGRFCDQRNFDIPFVHEFKLAGNYQLPKVGVDFGAVLQSYAGLERVITWQPAANSLPGPAAHAGADDRAERAGLALDRTLGSARHQLQEEHPVRQQGAYLPAGPVQRIQQQLDPHRDRRGRHVAWTGDGDHAWAVSRRLAYQFKW